MWPAERTCLLLRAAYLELLRNAAAVTTARHEEEEEEEEEDETRSEGEDDGGHRPARPPSTTPGPPQVLTCQRCREQFTDVPEYLAHRAECERKAVKHDDPAHSDPEDMVVSEEEEDDEEDEEEEGEEDVEGDADRSRYEETTPTEPGGEKRLERMRRHRQDAANNNSVEETGAAAAGDAGEGGPRLAFPPFPAVPPPAPGHVTLEALQNTKVAVAQFAATAMANNADNEAALQELAVLQSTLFTLQHQQVLQLQLINQLQHQLQIDRSKASSPVSPLPPQDPENEPDNEQEPEAEEPALPSEPSPPPQALPISREPTPASLPPPIIQPMAQQPPVTEPQVQITVPTSLPPQIQPSLCSISSSLASTIITHNNEPPPSLDEPNTLEMLQKRAQEVLDNASQGLLATNLADELAFRKSKGSMSPYDSKGRNEPFFKHRCRYCGKVFGSDSALQIHIRSHTGERPYKCNVCGSRFTTKGNLKVHFQRHSAKFPHIKMNPNPVPEHLDKYHPPLLAQLGQQPALSPGGPPHPPPHLFPGGHPFPPTSLPLYRPPGPPPDVLNNRLQPSPHRQDAPPRLFPPHPLFMKREEQDAPENLSKPARSSTPIQESPRCKAEQPEEKRDVGAEEARPMNNSVVQLTPKQEPVEPPEQLEHESESERLRFPSPGPFDECSMDSKYSNEDMLGHGSPGGENCDNMTMQDEPENLSNKSGSINMPLSISTGQRLPASFSFGHASSPPSSTSSGSLGHFPTVNVGDPAKDPAIYTNLLPRPGSNDNSWESLIEVTKTSETSKLQQLVDNIEHKLSDPNQCVICHRVLSCKSALQMHYRTHTGERPFKCKICGRAFTTKGNLKTHMGVHRVKPPMRVLHQCPVCHKKFTNALVLQQHIRLHTGEPTDLTPEQIQAAEVRDFPSPGGFPGLHNSMHPFLGQGFPVPGLSPLGGHGLPLGMKFDKGDKDAKSDHESMDEDDDDDDDVSTSDHQGMAPFSASPGELGHGAGMPVSTMASQLSVGGLSCSAEDLCSTRTVASASPVQNGEKSPCVTSPGSSEVRSSPNRLSSTPVQIPRPPSSQQAGSPTPSECNSLGALDLTPRAGNQPLITSPGPSPGPPPSLFSTFALLPPSQGGSPFSSALSSLTSSVLTSTAFSPLRLAVGPTAGRGNTTCNLCFKTFACHSALEIHYRSHTKERPFKCTVCDRGFSTKDECVCAKQRRIQDGAEQRRTRKRKPAHRHTIPPVFPLPGYASHWTRPAAGNMKQHMLTHKIRDMPQHMFDGSKPPSLSGDESQSSQVSQPPPPPPPPPPPLPPPSSAAHHPPPGEGEASPVAAAAAAEPKPEQQQPPPLPPPPLQQPPVKREPTESELPLPKRPPSVQASSKHLCHVCNKNFSSSSALQIHMRTHTGDKPFRCTVCQKAFTTKGNLKVHMGTHMWSNGASRRGRRMSLDLPPIPMTPKDSEFLQRRPDLFYPYLPAPFLNGMQQKLSEMSAAQGGQNGMSAVPGAAPPPHPPPPGPGKYAGLLGFGYPPPEALRPPPPGSPPERPERPGSRGGEQEARALWDLHFERRAAAAAAAAAVAAAGVAEPRDDLLPAGREGLAA